MHHERITGKDELKEGKEAMEIGRVKREESSKGYTVPKNTPQAESKGVSVFLTSTRRNPTD